MNFTFDPITNNVNNLFELFYEGEKTSDALAEIIKGLNRQRLTCDYRLFISKALDHYSPSEVTDLFINAIAKANRGWLKFAGELLKEEFARKR